MKTKMRKWINLIIVAALAIPMMIPSVASADEEVVLSNVGTLVGIIDDVDGNFVIIEGVKIDISSADVKIEFKAGDVVSIDATLSDAGSWSGLVVTTAEEDLVVVDDDLFLIGVMGDSADDVIVVADQKIKIKKNEIKLETWIDGARVKVKIKMKDGEWDAVKVDYHVPKGEIFDGVAVVMEGPVSAIDGNLISIYGTYLALDPNSLELSVLQIGDVIRINGIMSDLPVVYIINIVFINVEVYIFEGLIWRDVLNCAIVPPVWASADGWHVRCDTEGSKKKGSKKK